MPIGGHHGPINIYRQRKSALLANGALKSTHCSAYLRPSWRPLWRLLAPIDAPKMAHCALKMSHCAIKMAHCALKMAHCAIKMAHCALKMAHCRLTNVLLCAHWHAKIAH